MFVAGTGQELLDESGWKSVLRDDVVLLVSMGEEYVGARKEATPVNGASQDEISPSTQGNPDCPVNILAHTAYIDPLSLTQLSTTAHTLPGLIHAVGQPDLHPGTKYPIGAVFVSKAWIHPPLIGGDIGCGMAWYKTTLSRSQVSGDKGRKIAEKLRGLEGVWRTQSDREAWLSDEGVAGGSSSAGEEWDAALGTIGAGNHFAELQIIEEADTASIPGITPQQTLHADRVVLLVHSGSRGYGGDILKRYTADSRTSIHESDPLATEYLTEHDRACDWATKNRDLIALRFLACLEPGNEAWDLGINDRSAGATDASTVLAARQNVRERKVVDIWHNNVERVLWPPAAAPAPTTATTTTTTTITTSTTDILPTSSDLTLSALSSPPSPPASHPAQHPAYIHRKGAAPTLSPHTSLPLPLLPLPGSRATPTLLLHPLHPLSTAHGLTNGLSLAHGAGRSMSRAKASTSIARKYEGRSEDLLRGDYVRADRAGNKNNSSSSGGADAGAAAGETWGRSVKGGTWVVCEEKALVWEEAPEAYKDVWDVGSDLERAGCVERRGWARGVVSYKVRVE